MTRPVRALISPSALAHNLSEARRFAPNSRIMAVIKADAYGHGLVAAARALRDAEAFALVSLDEALQLREAGFQHRLVLLEGVYDADELEVAAAQRLEPVVHSERQLDWLEAFQPANYMSAWLKVNTGMNRLGFAPKQAPRAWQRLQRLPYLERLNWMSHLACADEPDHAANDAQLAQFNALARSSGGQDGGRADRSLANSAALLTRPDMQFDWVRPGIMLYGASPLADGGSAGADLKPAMTLESRLMVINRCQEGASIGYGQTWTCPQDMAVGVLAAGYGDGYPRHAPSGTPVLVNGERVPLIGRVSMDMICVDLRTQPQAQAGDPVVLWGEGLPVEEVARHAGTISYELLCGVTPRVPRHYLDI
jgi:alanine racemase